MQTPVPTSRSSGTNEFRFVLVVFIAALAFNLWGVGAGWTNGNLPGCEFRQTQTAVSALFIQREHNFSLAYPTPVLGKPWSIPMEFPLYQWTVVGVSNATGWELNQSARAVSAACFYLALPALYLLLGRLRLGPVHRLAAMSMVLVCPLQIFYARAFLIETMALMFGAWFLAAYVNVTEGRHRRWWVPVAQVAGIGCGLVKVTTLMFFLMPALGWTLWWLWRDMCMSSGRWRELAVRSFWCLAAALPACVAALWWVHYADAVKAASVDGMAFTSERLRAYNFGIGVRFAADVWAYHWSILLDEIASWPVLVVCGALAVVWFRRIGGMVAGLVALFFAIQLVFPVLYAWHSYYYVANAFVLMFALGIALGEVLESRVPRTVAWLVVLTVLGLQVHTYLKKHYPEQIGNAGGGNSLTEALRRITGPDEVLVICGDDWNSMIPYYAQRRAYMIRRDQERSWDMVLPAFYNLASEDVTALVLVGAQVGNHDLVRRAAERFGFDPRPAFRWEETVVYLHRDIRHRALPVLRTYPGFEVFEAGPNPRNGREVMTADLLRRDQELLPSYVDPSTGATVRPFKSMSSFDLAKIEHEGREFLMTHPDSLFWYRLGAGPHVLSLDAMLLPEAYAATVEPGDRSDGVEVRLERELTDGTRLVLFSRIINPRDNPADIGVQHLGHSFELTEECTVVFSVNPGPRGNASRDWAVMDGIVIH